MNQYLVLILFFSFETFSTQNQCALVTDELNHALENGVQKSRAIIETEMLQRCFNASLVVSNEYRGENIDYYQRFLDRLAHVVIGEEQQALIVQQLLESLSLFMGSPAEAKDMVNTIALWQFIFNQKSMHVIETGWGDDDHFYYVFFLADKTDMLLMGSN